MKDNWGDKIKVNAHPDEGHVTVLFKTNAQTIPMILSPEKARRLARKINRAASAVEIAGREHYASGN
jgi:hypothetical protein